MHTMRVHCAPPIDQSLSPSHGYPLGTHALIANPSPYISVSVCGWRWMAVVEPSKLEVGWWDHAATCLARRPQGRNEPHGTHQGMTSRVLVWDPGVVVPAGILWTFGRYLECLKG